MTNHISHAIPEVTVRNNHAITTSIAVANFFQKEHKNVLQKIRSLECSPGFTTANFSAVVINVKAGFSERETEAYEMTRNGFIFLVMGFTGKRAAAFKEAYIAEFDRLEAELRNSAPVATRQGNYSVITYFENGLPVACHPLMPGEVVMNPDSCLEHVMRCGFVVIPAAEAGRLTLDEFCELVARTKRVRKH